MVVLMVMFHLILAFMKKTKKKSLDILIKKNCERARKKFLYANLHFFFNLFLTL